MRQQKSPIKDKTSETGRLVRALRKEYKLSQQELADQAGLSYSFVNQVENGKETVRLDALNKLLIVFGYHMAPIRISRQNQKGEKD